MPEHGWIRLARPDKSRCRCPATLVMRNTRSVVEVDDQSRTTEIVLMTYLVSVAAVVAVEVDVVGEADQLVEADQVAGEVSRAVELRRVGRRCGRASRDVQLAGRKLCMQFQPTASVNG